MRRRGIPALLLTAALLSGTAAGLSWSGNNSNGGTAGAFLRMGYGARALAMGNAVIAHTGSPQFLLENPASLAGVERIRLNVTYHSLSLDRRLMGVAVVVPLPPAGVVGVQILQGGVEGVPEVDLDGRETGHTLSYRETVYSLAFVRTISTFLGFGGSFNIYTALFPEIGIDYADLSEATMGINLGVRVQPLRQLSIAATVRNLNAGYQWDSTPVWEEDGAATAEDLFPVQYGIGATWRFYLDEILLSADYVVSDRRAWDFNFGLEWTKPLPSDRFVSFRAGQMAADWTAGLGLQFEVLQRSLELDYAVRFAANDPAEVHVITWSFGL